MLLSRKRAREADALLPALPVLRRPERRLLDETWFLRDLRASGPARAQVLEFLQRHNRADDADADAVDATTSVSMVNSVSHERETAGQGEGARLSSQELFLSVVLEWQRAGADERARGGPVGRPADAWRLPSVADSTCSSSDSDGEEPARRRASLKLAEDVSPTSVYAVPQALTPLRLDARARDAKDEDDARGKKIGAYSPRARRELLRRYMAKRAKRLSQHTVRYRVRKTLANARPRVKGRFVKTQAPLTAAAVEAMQPASGDE